MKMNKFLTVSDLSKNSILYDINFDVEKGEMVAIMGPSGSGKSTLLYQISGMDRYDKGSVRIGTKHLEKMSEDELARFRLTESGFVFQNMNMLSNLSILDNILLPALYGKKKKKEKIESRRRAQKIMEKMAIENLASRSIAEVSGGQLQRACICRSIINEPQILFADEPTGALNQSASGEVMEELNKLNQEGTTIVLVTHDSKVASKCERIIYLLDGKIQGELLLSGVDCARKESKTAEWLTDMGW